MSANNFDACLKITLHYEGGFVDDTKDPGGMTNLGVTQKTYSQWIKHSASKVEMLGLTPDKVSPLYKAYFWDLVKGDILPKGLDLCIFDFDVNGGVHSAKALQTLVGATTDGHIGDGTIGKLNSYIAAYGVDKAIAGFQDLRAQYYHTLSKFDRYGAGWIRRTNEIKDIALKM